MSFSFNFITSTAERAIELLEKQNAPIDIRDYIHSAITGIVDRRAAQSDETPYLISVQADGHLCTGEGSYETTTATISVKPLMVTP